jgi:hypothetical protein
MSNPMNSSVALGHEGLKSGDAYRHLHSRIRLQPWSIMRELANGILSFKEPAVYLLFQQAAWQAETDLERVV